MIDDFDYEYQRSERIDWLKLATLAVLFLLCAAFWTIVVLFVVGG